MVARSHQTDVYMNEIAQSTDQQRRPSLLSSRHVGFAAGVLALVALLYLPTFAGLVDFMAQQFPKAAAIEHQSAARSMQDVFAVLALMVCWWLSEAVSIPVTALVPVALVSFLDLHQLTDAGLRAITPKAVLATYGDPIVFLFMGSFFLAAAMTAHGLDKRFTFWTLSLRVFARSPRLLVLGMITATGILSMWMNNTAVAAIMIPIALGIIHNAVDRDNESARNFGTVLLLGVGWASTIGGVATIVGTAPNGIAVSVLQQKGIHISFVEWLSFGLPIAALLLGLTWWYLSRRLPYGDMSFGDVTATIREQKAALGSMKKGEVLVLGIFLLTALVWIGLPIVENIAPEPLAQKAGAIDVWVVAMVASMLLFLIPENLREGKFLLSWSEAKRIDWGTLLLFGGGLALAKMMFETGGATFFAMQVTALLGTSSTIAVVAILVPAVIFLSEFTSNTALTSMMMPVAIPIAVGAGADPKIVGIAVALAASLAFMMPVGTPPNAIAFGTGRIPLQVMVRTGFAINIISWFVITLVLAAVLWIGLQG